MSHTSRLLANLIALGLLVATVGPVAGCSRAEQSSAWGLHRLSHPERVEVRDGSGLLATFTLGARTVTLRGRSRTFSDRTTDAQVTTTAWVRLLDHPFDGTVDRAWLEAALADRSPDILAIAHQYLPGATPQTDAGGRVIASDASYGPLKSDGEREEGSDFNDYLGRDWVYPSEHDDAERDQFRAMDCSGFVRMVFGYRGGVPMTRDPDGVRLPRRAYQMLESAPGMVIVPDTDERPGSTEGLNAGDLLFFDADSGDGDQIDHVGIYLGRDDSGSPRFLSSRKTADGPTLGDEGGRSTLDGDGLYAEAWRAARRL